MRTYMPPKLFGTIVLLLALILVGFAQTLEEAEETAQPETVSQPAVEEKRIESLPIPPTQFEIEEELKDAKQQQQSAERKRDDLAARLAKIQTIKPALKTLAANPKEMIDPILALRKEIAEQVSAKKLDPEKLRRSAANIKLMPKEAKSTLPAYAPPKKKDALEFFLEADPEYIRYIAGMPDADALSRLQHLLDLFPSESATVEIPQVLQSTVENAERQLEDAQKSASSIAAAWGKRHTVLSDQLRQLQTVTVTSLVERLPWLVAILAAFGVAAILLVRFFPEAIQDEWVASGQVIQLLTVVTLLLIILCLALANIIKENTIGTLLGGIGGYVLSQGIGRAAGRAAVRSASQQQPIQDTQNAGPDHKTT